VPDRYEVILPAVPQVADVTVPAVPQVVQVGVAGPAGADGDGTAYYGQVASQTSQTFTGLTQGVYVPMALTRTCMCRWRCRRLRSGMRSGLSLTGSD
jgi:hypothetical protein